MHAYDVRLVVAMATTGPGKGGGTETGGKGVVVESGSCLIYIFFYLASLWGEPLALARP